MESARRWERRRRRQRRASDQRFDAGLCVGRRRTQRGDHARKRQRCAPDPLGENQRDINIAFVNEAVRRTGFKRNPFHPFTTFDTATLAGLAFGQTVLSRAVKAAGMSWEQEDAHSAVYDAERTADLFCTIVNRWGEVKRALG